MSNEKSQAQWYSNILIVVGEADHTYGLANLWEKVLKFEFSSYYYKLSSLTKNVGESAEV